jgi:hypothetical protein
MRNPIFVFLDKVADAITGKVHGEFAMSKHRTNGDTTMLICIMLGVLGIVGLLFVLLSGA